ncbi:hypothetical protein [Paracraurococcus ruber]|nr:hypothetical protein [Paracraurococcus ruber]
MTRILGLAALAALVVAAACERPPTPVVDRSIERGTALPPPGLTQTGRR